MYHTFSNRGDMLRYDEPTDTDTRHFKLYIVHTHKAKHNFQSKD